MLLDFYHLRQQPFGVTPDPAFLYASRTHSEALDSLADGIEGGRGFLTLIAPPGMGKTTLLNQVLEALRDKARTAFLFQTQCSSREFFQYFLNELGVDTAGMGLVAMHAKLNEILFAEMLAGRRFVLIVDEAQNLDDSVLETIRLLSNFETSHTKLIQIVLAGQAQLADKLAQPRLAQLLQRITVLIRLEPLPPKEIRRYIEHRLKVAGHHGDPLFGAEALAVVAERSQGIPRVINNICFQALSEAFARGHQTVSAADVRDALAKLEPRTATQPTRAVAVTRLDRAPVQAKPQLTYKSSSGLGLLQQVLLGSAIAGVLLFGAASSLRANSWRTLRDRAEAAWNASRILQLDRYAVSWARSVFGATAQGAAVEPSAGDREDPSGPGAEKLNAKNQARIVTLDDTVEHDSPHLVAPSRAIDKAPIVRHDAVERLPTDPTTNDVPEASLTRELGLKVNRIVIDPGHGGYDTGTIGPHGLLEKDLCLDIALRLGQRIASIPGAKVIYTRSDDTYVPLEERTAIANRADGDLFISIHANSSDSPQARGVETYYLGLVRYGDSLADAIRENALSQSSLHELPDLLKSAARNNEIAESKQLATEIQNALTQELQVVSRHETNRFVRQAPFIVLAGAKMPSVLSEISFVSNAADESLLGEGSQRERVAEGIYRGIAAYVDRLHSRSVGKGTLVGEDGAAKTFEPAKTAVTASPN